MIPVITSNPAHDAAMYDIYCASLEPDYSGYPVCDICGEHIITGQKYAEPVDDIYIHMGCMKYIRWRSME